MLCGCWRETGREKGGWYRVINGDTVGNSSGGEGDVESIKRVE